MKKRFLSICLLLSMAGFLLFSLWHRSHIFKGRDEDISSTIRETQALDPGVQRQEVLSKHTPVAARDLNRAFEEARRRIRPLTERQQTFPENAGAAFLASTFDQRLRARFRKDGSVALLSGYAQRDWRAEMRLAVNSRPVQSAEVDGSELIYKHGDFESYYKNRSDGLEHGFTISREVSEFVDAETGDLVIPIELLGVRAEKLDLTSERGDLQFVDASGEALIAYTGLKVWDSTERLLAASMNPVANGFEIRVGMREVEYPIFVDPLITSLESKLGPSNTGRGDISDNFGLSVSILGDLAIMGAPNDGDNGSNS
ncbi:MAG: FG-GAP repeat protein, partial [Verrucomicrobiota bacterium]